ncbi:MAG TPA: GAF domain-containing protein, partial [Candidatus Wunengus sp. YC63]
MAKNHGKMPPYQSPIYLFVILAISVTAAEMQIMICFHFLPPFPMVIGAVIDSLLLFILLLPIIYFFVFRPLKLHISKREEAETALKLANEQLQCNITNRKQTEEKLRYLNTILISLRKVNEALLTCKEESHLFSKICDAILHMGFIKFVWIGVIEKGSSEVTLVAQKGFEDVFISSINIDLKDVSSHLDPIGKAIHTGEPVDLLDIERDSRKESWKDEAMKRGYASSVAIPVKDGGEVVGVLSVCSDKKYAFGKEEMGYLMEVANDIAVGVKSLWLEKDLKRSVGNLQKTLNGTIEAISLMGEMRDPYTAGHERRVAQLACAIAREIGMTDGQIEGVRVCAFLHDIGKVVVPAEILSKPSQLNEYEYGIV